MINIREANSNDNTILLELLSEVQKLHVINRPDFHLDVKVTFEQVYGTNIFEDPRYRVFVAVNTEDLTMGYILLRITDSKPQIAAQSQRKTLYIHELCVSEKHQRKGVGKHLVEKVIELGKDIGADTIELGVWEFNEAAIRFYEKMGLKTVLRRMEMKL